MRLLGNESRDLIGYGGMVWIGLLVWLRGGVEGVGKGVLGRVAGCGGKFELMMGKFGQD